jgi:hypothetical protein
MKILVAYSDNYKSEENKAFEKAVEFLKKQGHNLKDEKEIRKGKNSSSESQDRLEKAIRDCDIMIVDTSDADAKVGFDIAKGLAEKKVVITMQKTQKKGSYVKNAHSKKTRNLISIEYTDQNVTEMASRAVEIAKTKMDTKFILIISPEIERYMDWASQTKRMHKAQVVRLSIESMMAKDKEYKTFLQG